MTSGIVATIAIAVLALTVAGKLADRVLVSGPLAFTALGTVIGVSGSGIALSPEIARTAAAITLSLILFHDAADVQPRELRADAGLFSRLLLIGLPLTVMAGLGATRLMLPAVPLSLALFLAAALAPTDAGLGAPTVLNPVVPVRIRRALNVESGLNDGMTTPVVLLALAADRTGPGLALVSALGELAAGALIGAVLGLAAGHAVSWSARRGWSVIGDLAVASLVVPLAAYFGAEALGANAFVAAFSAGIAFGAAVKAADLPELMRPAADVSSVLAAGVWTIFGIVAVAHLGAVLTWPGALLGLLMLTLVRMLPVALALAGSGMSAATVAFIGWFGPRGLASVIFALIAVESDNERGPVGVTVGVIVFTVLCSVVLHGISASPLAARYGALVTRRQLSPELGGAVEPHRGRRRHSAGAAGALPAAPAE